MVSVKKCRAILVSHGKTVYHFYNFISFIKEVQDIACSSWIVLFALAFNEQQCNYSTLQLLQLLLLKYSHEKSL